MSSVKVMLFPTTTWRRHFKMADLPLHDFEDRVVSYLLLFFNVYLNLKPLIKLALTCACFLNTRLIAYRYFSNFRA